MQILRPDRFHLSPAIGLIALNSPNFMGNLHSCPANQDAQWGLGSSCSLARELFFQAQPGDPVRTTRSRSKAISHIDVRLLGSIVGLAMSRADSDVVAKTLRKSGIESNRIDGEWTGVSFVRFTRLVGLIADASHGNKNTPALMMLLQVVWEKAADKAGLLDFILALDEQYPVLGDGYQSLKYDTQLRDAFTSSQFELSEMNEAAAGHAAREVLQPQCHQSYALAMELLAVSLSQVHAFKPAIKVEYHSYKGTELDCALYPSLYMPPPPSHFLTGGKVVADCVEVVVREVLDLLLFNPEVCTPFLLLSSEVCAPFYVHHSCSYHQYVHHSCSYHGMYTIPAPIGMYTIPAPITHSFVLPLPRRCVSTCAVCLRVHRRD
jgi:hypothetical protein